MKRVRCAIYTRKSSEEGLEQDFNSLDAQYEACSAYILSQASEGWHQNAERYDDGGHSGGTLERPALKRLLNDVETGLIDIIIVYKLDRLTRSLLDFAQLVARLDKAGVSFVSITQSFNTTTSMGWLTLNMLLSFAQFEREVTAERIRDKIAASKAKGMWMGGTSPLGYAPDGRSLSIVPDHAKLIRHIYGRYLDIGNVRLLADELAREGIGLPIRTTSSGRSFGGGVFTRGQLYRILSNPIYIGQISHGAKSYTGLHEAIFDEATWNKVQAKLADSVRGQRQQSSAKHPSPLAGLLFDQSGEPLVATHAVKRGRRYRYYVSRSLQHGGDAKANDGMRILARDIEALVRNHLAALLADPVALLSQAGVALPSPDQLTRMMAKGDRAAKALRGDGDSPSRKDVAAIVERITIGSDEIRIATRVPALLAMLGDPPDQTQPKSTTLTTTINACLKRSGMAMRMVLSDGTAAAASQPDQTLIRTIARALRWWQRLSSEPELTPTSLAAAEGVTPSYLTRVLRLAFLDPAIIQMILDGSAPASLTAKRLTQPGAIAICWHEQRRTMGIAACR
jgi:site-specific DNA recombinase